MTMERSLPNLVRPDLEPQPLQALAAVMNAALTEPMVNRLAEAGAGGLELLDRLNAPETRAAIQASLDGITQLHQSGAMDTLFEMLGVLHALRSAMTDGMIERVAELVESVVTSVDGGDILGLAATINDARVEATRTSGSLAGVKSLWQLIRLASQPDNVSTLATGLAFGTALRKRLSEGQT